MKRILSVLTALAMVLSFTASAADDNREGLKKALQTQYTSAEVEVKAGISLKQPLSEVLDPDGEINKIFSDLSMNIAMKLKGNEEGTRLMAEMGYDMTVAEEPVDLDIWIDMDLTAQTEPRYIFVLKTNTEEDGYDPDKYYVIDYSKIMDLEQIKEITKKTELAPEMPDELFENIKVEREDNVYSVTFDEEEAKALFMEICETANSFMSDASQDLDLEELSDTLAETQLMDKDEAAIFEAEVDKDGNLIAMKIVFNIDTSLASLYNAVGETVAEELNETNSAIKAVVSLDYKFKALDETYEIKLPELTEENSVDVTEAMQGPGIDENEINVIYNGQLIAFEEKPIIENDRTFLPVRKLANTFGIPDEAIGFDGSTGTVTISCEDCEIVLTIGSDRAMVNGEEKIIDVPAFIRNDRTYLPLRFVAESFGKTVEWMPMYDEEGNPSKGSIIVMSDIIMNVSEQV